MTQPTPAARVRANLKKELGLTARQVSVRTEAGSLEITIKAPGVSVQDVEAIASREEQIRYDHVTGDILRGGNRFVSVGMADSLVTEAAQPLVSVIESIPRGDGAVYELNGTCGLAISRDHEGDCTVWRGRTFLKSCWGSRHTAQFIASECLQANQALPTAINA